MSKLTPEQFQEKHNRRLKASLQDMALGVNRVTVSPTAEAAKKIEKMRNNFNAAIDSGKTKRRMEAVTVDYWKKQMIDIGIPRVNAGIDGAKDKVTRFAAELLAYEDTLQAKVRAMPDANIQDSANRAVAWIMGMNKFERKS